jgi:sulfoacetaldehyde dehydrogenase
MRTIDWFIHVEFAKIGEDPDLVQMVPAPGSKVKTQRLMETCDKIICTGSQNNVYRAQTAGTPAVAVGAGNVTVIVDETADLHSAAEKIRASKTFDNATSCSSENSVIVVDAIYQAFLDAVAQHGGCVVTDEAGIVAKLWPDGHLNRSVIAQDADKMIQALELDVPEGTEYIVVPTTGIGAEHPLSGEKLSRVLALYRADDFEHAASLAREIQSFQGAGHSVGIHTTIGGTPCSAGQGHPNQSRYRQSSAYFCDWWGIYQWYAIFAKYGVRQLGGQCNRRQFALASFSAKHQNCA